MTAPVGKPPVVILAAGNGHRLITPEMGIPKPLYQVMGAPLVDHVIAGFAAFGFERFVIVAGFLSDRLREHVAARHAGRAVDVVFNPEYNADNGLSVLAAASAVKSGFILAMADHLFEPALVRTLVDAGPEPGGITLAVDRRPDRVFDVEEATKAQLDGDRVTHVSKAITEFDAVDTGFFYAGPELFDALAECRTRGRTKLADGVNALANERRVRAVDIGDARWIDVDTPQALAEVERWLVLEPSVSR
jgi:1L-myo-inositol 1-phosphate cytidylyltransferase